MHFQNTIKLKQLMPQTWFIFLSYISLLFFFNYVDVYNNHFFTAGWLVILYNFYRLFFILALSWFFYIVGQLTLSLPRLNLSEPIPALDKTIASLIVGIGITHITLFIVGLTGHYSRLFAAIITLFIFTISLPRLNSAIQSITTKKIKQYYLGALILALPVTIFLLTKGLYPAGGHDYYNHYFHFYRKVTDSGNIMPNEVWYHFYYSKGAALFFLSMLLTDPLAPQLATVSMLFLGATVVFSITNRSAYFQFLPWLSVALYIFFLIYTPGPLENMRQGGWGDLEKPHEPAAVLVMAMLWTTIQLSHTKNWLYWGVVQCLAISALILINPVMSVFTAFFLAITSLGFLYGKKPLSALASICNSIVAGTWLIAIWLINYLLTGLPDDQNLFLFWPIINFDTAKEWGILFEILVLHWSKTGLVANSVPLSLDILPKILTYLRLDVWWPLFCLALTLFIISLATEKWRTSVLRRLDKSSTIVLGGFLLLFGILSLFIGRDQAISFYRFTTFNYAPMLCICMILLCATVNKKITVISLALISIYSLPHLKSNQWSFLSKYPSIQNFVATVTVNYDNERIKNILKNSLKFVSGRYSLANAYQNQTGWPGRMPWGGIYPPLISIWEKIPRNTPIWSMHVHTYCMLPGCRMEGHMSFRLSNKAAVVYYGNPLDAKLALQQANHHYFFISNSLQLTDPLPLSPLFSPNNIAKYFGVVWTDGDNTLLTWKERSSKSIDTAWLKNYQHQVSTSPTVISFPYKELKLVLKYAEKNTTIKETNMPWYRAGWK